MRGGLAGGEGEEQEERRLHAGAVGGRLILGCAGPAYIAAGTRSAVATGQYLTAKYFVNPRLQGQERLKI